MVYSKDGKSRGNPREEANILSLFTFGYVLGTFKRGFKNDLEEEDLYEVIKSCRSKKCGDRTEKEWNKCRSIYELLWTRFGLEYSILCLVSIVWTEIYSIYQPIGMSRLISYFEGGQSKISKSDAYAYAGLVAFLKIASFFVWQNLYIYEINCGIKIRASLKSLLYRKALKLSPAAFSDTSLGNIVTILTKDINAIETNLWVLNEFVTFIIRISTIGYLLWAKMGNTAFVAIAILFTVIPLQLYLSALLTKIRLVVGQNTDERIQVTQETLSAIKILKMYTWENFFNAKISQKRHKEATTMIKAFYIKYVVCIIGLLTTRVTFLVLILTYVWMGYTTNTEMIFYVYTLFSDITNAFAFEFSLNISKAAEFRAAIIRLNKLLQVEEAKNPENKSNEKPGLELDSVTVVIKDKKILDNVSLKIHEPSLTLVTGAVGSGKSSLIKTALLEYTIRTGNVNMYGSVSYASQEPWLFPSSIKQNILFGERFDKTRYQEVIKVCALEYDFSLLENGDETVVADRGINLSKGQKSRINLARAVYKNSDIYLLDDSLTALDGRVQDFIFYECLKKFLGDKICILVTQNVGHLEKADYVVVMDHGKISASGNAKYVVQNIINNGENNVMKKKVSTVSNSANVDIKEMAVAELEETKPQVYHEIKQKGKVKLAIYKNYFQLGGGLFVFSFIMLLFTLGQFIESSSDNYLTEWVDLQQEVLDHQSNSSLNGSEYETTVSEKDKTFNIYTTLTVVNVIMMFIKFYALLRFCRQASIGIHRVMSEKVIKAVMSFFDTHFIGNILNRFSYDLNNIDENLPFVFPDLVAVGFICVGAIVLTASVSYLLLIPSCIFVLLLVLMRVAYIPTSRSLKRMEATTRSPLVGHINASLEGLTTIRAFRAENILKDEFDKHQDLFTSAYFTLNCTITGFNFFMDMLCSFFSISVVARFLFFEHDISAGNVGLALNQVFMLTEYIQWGIRQWTELENYMTSVERALEYIDIQQETTGGSEIDKWPGAGGILYENVSLTYENTKEPVLKSLSFQVKPKQKIGIVGRTGAGKSSIISTLFRLYHTEGKIFIDGVNINTLPLKFLRENIAIIPQDPVLFTGTLRENIDPYNKYSDEIIWNAIEKVGIKDLISSLTLEIEASGSHYSAGQKQLICLARAAVRKCQIVVLDEATANMDAETDKMLHNVIADVFANCTVLIIAHRLNTILGCDLVMVLADKKLVEFDSPNNLLNNKASTFYKMCKESKKS